MLAGDGMTRARSLFIRAAAGLLLACPAVMAQESADCLNCHGDKSFSAERGGKAVLLFVDGEKFKTSSHGQVGCVGCHSDLAKAEFPHAQPARVQCGPCHQDQEKLYADSLHGKSLARGDSLAPSCRDCHGGHDIRPAKDPQSSISPIKVPFVCGSCHQEGGRVARQRDIPQHNILENYYVSIHGEGLMSKGLSVSATCTSCPTRTRAPPSPGPTSPRPAASATR